jgi:hypothetical protein
MMLVAGWSLQRGKRKRKRKKKRKRETLYFVDSEREWKREDWHSCLYPQRTVHILVQADTDGCYSVQAVVHDMGMIP